MTPSERFDALTDANGAVSTILALVSRPLAFPVAVTAPGVQWRGLVEVQPDVPYEIDIPQFIVRVRRAGQPVASARVTAGTYFSELTDAQGEVSVSATVAWPVAVPLAITWTGGVFGGGPFTLTPGVPLVIEV